MTGTASASPTKQASRSGRARCRSRAAAMSGEDGLNVFVRSLETATPLNRVRVQLLARNNEVLSVATTDRDGMAHFDRGLLEGTGGRLATAGTGFRRVGGFSF